MDPPGHLLSHQFHQKQESCPKIQPCDAVEELRAYTNGGHQDYDHTATLKMSPSDFFKMDNPLQTYSLMMQ